MRLFAVGGTLAVTLAFAISGCAPTEFAPSGADDGGAYSGSSSTSDTGDVPTAPEAPPIDVPAEPAPASFEIGSDFDQSCSVAWPSAPTVTTTSIQLTLSCSGVPSTYPLVIAVYPDPSLSITPSTGQLRVAGTIVDIGTSESGLVFLIVSARSITF